MSAAPCSTCSGTGTVEEYEPGVYLMVVGCPDCCRDCLKPWAICDCDHLESGSEWQLGVGP